MQAVHIPRHKGMSSRANDGYSFALPAPYDDFTKLHEAGSEQVSLARGWIMRRKSMHRRNALEASMSLTTFARVPKGSHRPGRDSRTQVEASTAQNYGSEEAERARRVAIYAAYASTGDPLPYVAKPQKITDAKGTPA